MDINTKKGLLFGVITVFLVGLQPVIANSRPPIIDPFIFAAITALIEAVIFLPIYYFERRKLSLNQENDKNKRLLNGWKKKDNIKLLVLIGLTFAIIPILLYIGYEITGSTNSTIILKSEIIFGLLFGFLILNEKVTKIQVIFCLILFTGLFFTVTQGFSNIDELNIGVLILIISVASFTFIHTLTKVKFDRNELFPTQIVFIRNLMSGLLLLALYLIIFPIDNLQIVFNPNYFLYFLYMGLDYGFSLYFWYKTLTFIQIGTATIVNSLTPFSAAFFSFVILGDAFTIFHLIGVIIIIISIIVIVREKENKKKLEVQN
ncbi:MAG: DMT family transporter [Candidatus Thorarchaeota archaeon]